LKQFLVLCLKQSSSAITYLKNIFRIAKAITQQFSKTADASKIDAPESSSRHLRLQLLPENFDNFEIFREVIQNRFIFKTKIRDIKRVLRDI